jgi:hypothetical protein
VVSRYTHVTTAKPPSLNGQGPPTLAPSTPLFLTVQLEHPRRASALRQRERGVELVKHGAAAGTRERRARREPHPEVADRHVMRRDQPSAPP